MESFLTGEDTTNNLVELYLLYQLLRRRWKVKIRHIPKNHAKIIDHMTKYPVIKNLNL